MELVLWCHLVAKVGTACLERHDIFFRNVKSCSNLVVMRKGNSVEFRQ